MATCKEKVQLCFINILIYRYEKIKLSIDSFCHFVYKNIQIRLLKNVCFTRYFISEYNEIFLFIF